MSGEEQEQKSNDAYLGDGVYASYDGYQIWLAVNDHRNKVVAIEPNVMLGLLRYALDTNFIEISVEGVGGKGK